MQIFETHEGAIAYAKENIGVVITRSSNGLGYMVKGSREPSQCDVFKAKETSLKSTVSLLKSTVSRILKKELKNDSRSILNDTKDELNYVVACILQTNTKTANHFTKEVGQGLASKLAGVGVSGGLLSLISTFGTASTGTAISSLAGASATNATMYWVGSIVGGGMFAGSLLTGGLAVGVGVATYKLLSSNAREYSDINDVERDIVDKCIFIVRMIDELNDKLHYPSASEMKDILREYICPLNKLLVKNEDKILVNLDKRNALALNVHAIPDFENLTERYKNFGYK